MIGQEAMIIPYLGLANGEYSYTYKVGDAFFANFEKSKINEGTFDVEVALQKRDRMIILMIQSSGTMRASCDRCLTIIDVPISYDDRLILKVQEAPKVQEDEVYYLDPKTSHIDLSTYIYESIHLHLPITNLRDCEEEGYKYCDHDALDALEGQEDESPDVDQSGGTWNALKDLDLNN